MIARQRAWPRQWLMTDERLGDRLWSAIARLPEGAAGLVFRHYATPRAEREALALMVAQACRARQIVLAIAGDVDLAERLGADLAHNPAEATALPFSKAVHTLADAREARRSGAAMVFVSPVNATRSHPGRPSLGVPAATQLAQAAGVPAIALGGMSAAAFAALPLGAFHGWAGIDAWVSDDAA
jgi:thiamine-phosphate pyrophosphorylase